MWLVVVLSVFIIACGDATRTRTPGSESAAALGPKDAVLDRSVMEASRPGLQYWDVSPDDVVGLRGAMVGMAEHKGRQILARKLPDYFCQYVGLVEEGQERIWVTCRCEVSPDWRQVYRGFSVEAGDCFVEASFGKGRELLRFSAGQ